MKLLIAYVLSCCLFLFGCRSNREAGKASTSNGAKEKFDWEEVQRLYEKAKSAGDDVPQNAVEWVKEDLQRIGAWEYRIVALQTRTDRELEKELGKLGKDRWECFWLERDGRALRVALKRPAKSYLHTVPVKELMKFIPKDK